MKNLIYFITVIVFLFNCKEEKDMSLYMHKNLNDAGHIGNLETKKIKDEVFKTILGFDGWYRENYSSICYNEDAEFWNTCLGVDTDDKSRIELLIDSVIPKIPNCPYISENLKQKALKNSKKEDPGNLGVILTGSNYGNNIRRIASMSTESERLVFHQNVFLNTTYGRDNVEGPGPRPIDYEEAKFYHFNMIRIVGNTHAYYRVERRITNADEKGWGYMVLELSKEAEGWIINEMYFIEQEELIDAGAHFGILDYFENKEAYETGIPADGPA